MKLLKIALFFCTLAHLSALNSENLKNLNLQNLNLSEQTFFYTEYDAPTTISSGYASIFAKSSALGRNSDSYGTANLSLNLKHKIHEFFWLNLGIFAAAPIISAPAGNVYNYMRARVASDKAYLQFLTQNHENYASLKIGRFETHSDWLGEHIQGAELDFRSDFFRIWASLAHEQAHINMEEQSDFEEFRKEYLGKKIFAAGVDLGSKERFFGAYNYYFADIFNTIGAKVDLSVLDSQNSRLKILAHAIFSKSYEPDLSEDLTQMVRKYPQYFLHSNYTHARGDKNLHDTYFLMAQASWHKDFSESKMLFGAGASLVGKGDFINGYLGNRHIFEADDETPFMFNVIAPGGWHNGSNATNMYYANTRSVWAFGAWSYGRVALNLMARHSVAKHDELVLARLYGVEQMQGSLGANFQIFQNLQIGAVAVYMRQEHIIRDDGEQFMNSSYAKAFMRLNF